MKARTALLGAAIASMAVLALLVVGTVFAQAPRPGGGYGPGGMMGGGMMSRFGGYGPGPAVPSGEGPSQGPGWGMGPGMMGGGHGGMMGGWWGQSQASGTPIPMDQAEQAVRQYLAGSGYQGLEIGEIMEFENNLYADVKEKDTGIHAVELLIDRYTGAVYPEMGPNMMWNTKYGHMGGGMMGGPGGMMGRGSGWGWGANSPTADMPVKPDQAVQLANEYLAQALPGTTAEEAETFYGYYTLHTMKDGKITGMLSVNGYTGQVWYHWWHGAFLGMKELED